MESKIILFELNEVPLRVFEEYCRWQPSSALAQRLQRCLRYRTVTEDVGRLSPWITWPSLHRGVSNAQHLLSDFGQSTTDLDQTFPTVWQILQANGISTGVGGSLHTYPLPTNVSEYAFYLPDTFAAGAECFPRLLEPFQELNLRMARDSARNVSHSVPWLAALRLLRAAPALGLRLDTALDIAGQLAVERVRPPRAVRRRTYQGVLAFDVFMRQLERTRPAFSTFFTNHVASAMHRYWAAAFPADYAQMDYDGQWLTTYRDEIRFAMGKAATFLERLFRFADRHPEYSVWIATSMGQAATRARPLETQLYVTESTRLMSSLGFEPGAWEARPAMLPQFNVAVGAERQQELASRLSKVRIAGAHALVFRVLGDGVVCMDFGHENLANDATVSLDGTERSLASLGLTNVAIRDRSGTSAYHIPDGCLFVYQPSRRASAVLASEQVSTLEIAPALLANFGVERPGYMRPAPRLAS